MKLLLKTVYYSILAFLLTIQVNAQVYPVQLNPIYNVPYSSKIADYANSFDEKIRLIVNPTDININNRQIRLKLYINGNGINAQSSNYVQGLNPIYINGGELLTLTNLDFGALFQLQNLEGLTPYQYANPLPDGLYTVCFEMYDVITNQKLSKKSCTNIFFQLNDPPLLNIPTRNEQIAVTEFPNILFTWTPRQINATNVSYKFELKEILDSSIDPQFAFQVSPLILEESLFSTALLYDLSKPTLIPGKTYAWRVKAISTSGLSENNVFKNNGYSEIFSFRYLANCPVPAYLLSEAQSTSKVKLTWQGNPENKKYHVQYKKKNVANAEWFSIYTLNTQAIISDLEANKTYEFRVGATCDPLINRDISYVYSGINQFTMPAEDATSNSSYNCGINPSISVTNRTPITNLIINETFTAGDFPVKILEISGNGTYTGRGYIIVPYLADTKLAVEFNNITINTDYQLINGIVETTYNPDWTNISDVEDLTDNGDVTITTVPFVITDITVNAAGDVLVSGSSGQLITVPGGGNIQLVDSAGNIYTVDENGNIAGPFQEAPGGVPTPANTDGVNQSGQATAISAEGVLVTFEKASNNVYGFDSVASNANSKIKALYKSLNANYYMPYKSVLNTNDGGIDDYIIAKIDISDSNIIADSIVFKTEKGIKIESQKISDKEYKLILKGNFKNTEVDILASIKQGDKYKIAGAFKLMYLAKRTTAKVILVNTDTATLPNKTTLQTYLNDIYKVAGANFEVIETINLSINDKLSDINKIASGESGLVANYTTEQQAINNAIMATPQYTANKDAYYLIITNKKPTKQDEMGFMPLGRQFGYIFSGGNHTIAHELGHGIFQLKHPFSSTGYNLSTGATNWLMDYSDNDDLPYVHWKQIQSPSWRIGIFDNDAEGESSYSYEEISTLELNESDIYTGIEPSGKIIENISINDSNKFIIQTISTKYQFLISGISIYKYLTTDKKTFEKVEYYKTKLDAAGFFTGYYDKNGNVFPGTITYKNSGLVNLNFSLGQNQCKYYYGKINWESKIIKTQELIIQLNNKWLSINNKKTKGLFDPDPSCFIMNSLSSLIDKDSKDCDLQKINADDNKLNTLFSKTNFTNEELINLIVVEGVCLTSLKKISWDKTSKAFMQIGLSSELKENAEICLLRLMSSFNSSNYLNLINLLEGADKQNTLLFNIISKINDRSINPYDGNNFTSFISGLLAIYSLKPDVWQDRLTTVEDKNLLGQIISLSPFKFKSDLSGNLDNLILPLNEAKFEGKLIDNKIEVYRFIKTLPLNITGSGYGNGYISIPQWTKDTDFETIKLKPLDPVIILTKDNLPLVETAIIGSEPIGENIYIVPAIFLEFKTQKEFNDATEKGIIITLDVGTILGSGGTALITKLHWARRLWALSEVVGAASNIAVNVSALDPNSKYGKAVEYYNMAMGIIGLKNGAKGLKNVLINLPQQTKNLIKSKNSLKSILLTHYTNWKIATTNLDGLDDVQRQIITNQEKVWKDLGIIDYFLHGAGNSLFGRNIINGINGFSDNVVSFLSTRGLSLNDFKLLQQKRYDPLFMTPIEMAHIDAIRNSIPMPDANTLLQKVIPKNDISKYLNGDYKQVGGFVSTAKDAKHLNSFEDVYQGMRLDYPGTQFNLSDGSFGVIRYKTPNPNLSVPKLPEVTGDLPYTGNGFTGGNNGKLGAPEWKSPYNTPTEGSELWEVFSDGTEVLKAKFSTTQNKFIPVP